MKKLLFIALLVIISCKQNSENSTVDLTTKFEISKGTETTTYKETIAYFKLLANNFSEISIQEMGETDSGFPLHLVLYNSDNEFDLESLKKGSKNIILINNGIHPGEPDGVDASMMLLRDIAQNEDLKKQYKNVVLAVIPMYNIGGSLNRNSHSRANQNGPEAYGFRGNARNFDLNRDFIKSDTKNAQSFAQLFHALNPDVFVDNHVSNGADYQYGITHLFTQHNKLGNGLGEFLEQKMRPQIEASLLEKEIIITPYVNVWGKTPDIGFSQFFDNARYSTGYTTLFNTFGLMIETHMLKPYKQRVEETYALLESIIEFTSNNSDKIKELRTNAVEKILSEKEYAISYELDKTTFSTLQFKGYEGSLIDSKVTTGKRLFYNRSKPFTKPVKYFNTFKSKQTVKIPKAYILKSGWWKVIENLKNNNIQFTTFKKDTTINVIEQKIEDYKTMTAAYEGHYPHFNTTISQSQKEIHFSKGDIYIPTNQNGVRYIIETFEAEAPDSFFNWNYFDTILQKKEGYSAYVFEDIAEEILNNNPSLKEELQTKIKTDTEFAKNPRAQLDFIYKNSPYYEKAHLTLPIYKVY
ncbi:M14 family metallopeptidase [Lutibacter sp. TH_r2]|uniref:M14 family metallopeptidase n=1 Tax=Lutibacter sp. TH_r2 TaxID=3082083 RepID=UPI002952DBAE|nr:M14 family metallopeptidase [Lutibacter sp. TH_r2]MDV7187196.1 M14 family metallopeptidase [Lutibacter sp. TH_r2]